LQRRLSLVCLFRNGRRFVKSNHVVGVGTCVPDVGWFKKERRTSIPPHPVREPAADEGLAVGVPERNSGCCSANKSELLPLPSRPSRALGGGGEGEGDRKEAMSMEETRDEDFGEKYG
jgi:hypothetical protein